VRARWAPHLVAQVLPMGAVLQSVGEPIRNVYFPQDAVVGQFHEAAPGMNMAVVLKGSGGLVGYAGVLSNAVAGWESVVVRPGSVLRLGLDHLRNAMDRDTATRHRVLDYVQLQIVQIAQAALCSRFHDVEQQLCMRLDQMFNDAPANELAVTQELLARIVGARRERVNQIIGELLLDGVVESGRGWLRLADREALIQRTCECRQVLACRLA
jgi:CRP-like cAMP-binding protein